MLLLLAETTGLILKFDSQSEETIDLREVKVTGPVEVVQYSTESVTLKLPIEGDVSDAFKEWFQNPSKHQSSTNFVPLMCRITSNGIQFDTTEAESEPSIKMVKSWIQLANSHAENARLENQRLQAKQLETQTDQEKKRQALQERLKDV